MERKMDDGLLNCPIDLTLDESEDERSVPNSGTSERSSVDDSFYSRKKKFVYDEIKTKIYADENVNRKEKDLEEYDYNTTLPHPTEDETSSNLPPSPSSSISQKMCDLVDLTNDDSAIKKEQNDFSSLNRHSLSENSDESKENLETNLERLSSSFSTPREVFDACESESQSQSKCECERQSESEKETTVNQYMDHLSNISKDYPADEDNDLSNTSSPEYAFDRFGSFVVGVHQANTIQEDSKDVEIMRKNVNDLLDAGIEGNEREERINYQRNNMMSEPQLPRTNSLSSLEASSNDESNIYNNKPCNVMNTGMEEVKMKRNLYGATTPSFLYDGGNANISNIGTTDNQNTSDSDDESIMIVGVFSANNESQHGDDINACPYTDERRFNNQPTVASNLTSTNSIAARNAELTTGESSVRSSSESQNPFCEEDDFDSDHEFKYENGLDASIDPESMSNERNSENAHISQITPISISLARKRIVARKLLQKQPIDFLNVKQKRVPSQEQKFRPRPQRKSKKRKSDSPAPAHATAHATAHAPAPIINNTLREHTTEGEDSKNMDINRNIKENEVEEKYCHEVQTDPMRDSKVPTEPNIAQKSSLSKNVPCPNENSSNITQNMDKSSNDIQSEQISSKGSTVRRKHNMEARTKAYVKEKQRRRLLLSEQERLLQEAANRAKNRHEHEQKLKLTQEGTIFSNPILNVKDLPEEHWRWKNFYSRLGLPQSSTNAMIKKQYRKLALVYHPDKGGCSSRFNAIREAYDYLMK